MIGTENPHSADQQGHLGCGQSRELGAIEHHLFRGNDIALLDPIAIAFMQRFEHIEDLDIGHLVGRIAKAWYKRDSDIPTSDLGCLFDADVTGQYDDVGQAGTGIGRNCLEHTQYPGKTLRFVAFPVLLRGQAIAYTIGATTLARTKEGSGVVQAVATISLRLRTLAAILFFTACISKSVLHAGT